MSEILMIEERLIQHLAGELDAPVLMEVPEIPSADYPEWPEELVVVSRLGGSKTDHLSEASFALQSYGESLYAAAKLNQKVQAAMEDFYTLQNIGRVHLSSCYNHTDTRSGRYRYQSTYNINFMDLEV